MNRDRLFSSLRSMYFWISLLGVDGRKFLAGVQGLPRYFREYTILLRQRRVQKSGLKVSLNMPCLSDRSVEGGKARGHYFHQDLLIANRIFKKKPRKHVDVASRIDGFVAHVASFRTIEVLDIRPVSSRIKNIVFRRMDVTQTVSEFEDYCDSLSCLHALEHFGLGRYGDAIDFVGHVKGFENLTRMLKQGGMLYLSVPIGPERIDFNAHRVFHVSTILDMAADSFELKAFSYIDDSGDLHENVKILDDDLDSNFGCYYGCGVFEFRKTNENPKGKRRTGRIR